MTPREVAEAYCERVAAGDADDLLALFADDAVLLQPMGVFQGALAIRRFYEVNVLPHGVRMEVTSWLADERTCAFEFVARAGGATEGPGSAAIDHLTLGADGLISRLAVYYRR